MCRVDTTCAILEDKTCLLEQIEVYAKSQFNHLLESIARRDIEIDEKKLKQPELNEAQRKEAEKLGATDVKYQGFHV